MPNPSTLTLGLVARSQYGPLKDGSIWPGWLLVGVEVAPMHRLFDRMIKNIEFDVSEMAIVTYLQGKEIGKPLTAIPIFPLRVHFRMARFSTTLTQVSHRQRTSMASAWASAPTRVLAGVWAGCFVGVRRRSQQHHLGAQRQRAPGRVPESVQHKLLKGANLGEMLINGEIAAAIGLQGVDAPNVKTLIDSPRQAQAEWYAKTGVFPINNTIVVKDELLAADPSLAASLFAAFREAKHRYLGQLKANGAQGRDQEVDLRFMEIVGDDPLPVGIEANRSALETVVEYSVDQGVISRRFSVDELFAGASD